MANTGLPPNWEVRQSKSRNVPYYFDATRNLSRWDPPDGTDTDALRVYLTQHHFQAGTDAAAPKSIPGRQRVRASHILVKHRDSRNPTSWRQTAKITRSKDEAMAILQGYWQRIKAAEAEDGERKAQDEKAADTVFREIASEYSDCNSHKTNGDLGWFGRGQMQKEFEDAAFALKVNELSGIVSSSSGVHLIRVTAEEPSSGD